MAVRLFNRPGRPQHRLPDQVWSEQNTGTVAPAEYQWGTHLAQTYAEEAGKSRVFRSVVAAAVSVGILGTFVSAPQPAYAEPASFFQKSVVSGQTTPVIRQLWAPPQPTDFTLQATFDRPRPGPSLVRPFVGESVPADQTLPAWVWRGAPGYQGPTVEPFTIGEVPADLSRPASIWNAATTPPSLASAVRAIWAAPQPVDLTLQASFDRPRPGPSLVRPFVGDPVPVDLTLPAQVWRAVPGYQGPTVRAFSAEQAVRDPTQQGSVWSGSLAVPSTGFLGKFLQGAPAPSDPTLQGWVQRGAPGYQGRTVVSFVSRSEQVDLTQQGLVVAPAVAQLASGAVPPFAWAAPQLVDWTPYSSTVWAAIAIGEPGVVVPVVIPGDNVGGMIFSWDDTRRRREPPERRPFTPAELDDDAMMIAAMAFTLLKKPD